MMETLRRHLLQLPGYKTNRKLVIIESDDWGSSRTSNKRAQAELSSQLPSLSKDPYYRYDALENADDLNSLFEVLSSVKDANGNPCKLTANTIMANPDFEKIKTAHFQNYYFEDFSQTLFNRDGNNKVLNLIHEGISKNIYQPQLHGREHLNIQQWLGALNKQHRELILAFNQGMFGISLEEKINMRKNVMAALDFLEPHELKEHQELLTEAQNSFKAIFGFTSKTFIAPSYIWHKDHEPFFKKMGITTLQGLPYQYQPNPQGKWYKTSYRYTGMQSKSGMKHLVRNAFFEPALTGTQNAVEDCLKRIEIAFRMRKPAIIGSHRLNFMGSLEEKNRKNNLILFKTLLQKIVAKWPEVEFVSSDELAWLLQNK